MGGGAQDPGGTDDNDQVLNVPTGAQSRPFLGSPLRLQFSAGLKEKIEETQAETTNGLRECSLLALTHRLIVWKQSCLTDLQSHGRLLRGESH